jgi:hypothetical protein
MKKEYIKPEIVMEVFATDSMLALSTENMGSNETPGTDDDFNSGVHRGEWGNLWKNGK